MATTWQTVRVFISSTFRDMHAERDHLVKVVVPRLRQWCEQRRLHLVDIDLRWGVTKEDADNGKAIEICLQEIDGSRPFFLCLLGSRYGWVPDELPPEEMYEFKGLQAETHLSITHLEILHAALESIPTKDGQSKPVCQQAFFYFRDPKCLPAPETLKKENREQYTAAFFEQLPERKQMLDDLKVDIRRRYGGADRVFDYTGRWDAEADNPEDELLKGRLTDLQAFGERVESDVKRGITEQFAEHLAALDDEPDPLVQERALHEAFIEDRTRVHVPRTDVEKALTDYVQGDECRPLVLSGPPGSGKSAILAHWVKERMMDEGGRMKDQHSLAGQAATDSSFISHPSSLVIPRFIGASPASTSLHRLMENVCRELVGRFDLQEEVEIEEPAPGGAAQKVKRIQAMEIPADPVELRRKWPKFLESAAARGPVVLVLDAVNQLDASADPLWLSWIPRQLPAGLKLIVSVLDHGEQSQPEYEPAPDEPADWLRSLRRIGLASQDEKTEVPVLELDDEARRKIIHDLPSVFCKRLEPPQIDLLLKNQATRNPLFLLVALEELRVFGSFEKLPERMAKLPRIEHAAEIESALDAVFGQVLDRLARETHRQTPELVPTLFRLLASAREGLSEQELSELLARQFPQIAEDTRNGAMHIVLRQLRRYLMRKGTEQTALIDFYHRSFWKAARAKYLPDACSRHDAHHMLAEYFDDQAWWLESVDEQRSRARRLPATPRSANLRKVTELPAQRFAICREAKAGELAQKLDAAHQQVEELFTTLDFLEAKKEGGLVFELPSNFSQALEILPKARPTHRILKLLDVALRRDIHFIARHAEDYPQALFQCLWNSCWWYDCPEVAQHYTKPQRQQVKKGKQESSHHAPRNEPALRHAEREGYNLHKLLEHWREQKQQSTPDFPWLRSQRPPPIHVGAAQLAVFSGHERAVMSVSYGQNGTRITSGGDSFDQTVRVWDAATGEELACLRGHEDAVTSVSYSPDGIRIVSGSGDKTVRVWDAATGEELACLRGHERAVMSVRYSPDGTRIASGSADNTVRVWDAASGVELAVLRGHEDSVECVSYSPDGTRIASGGSYGDKTVRVWDAASSVELAVLRGHEAFVSSVSYSPDGIRIVSGSGDAVRVWDAASGVELAVLRGHESWLTSVSYSPDGTRIASGGGPSDRTVRVWDAATGEELACLRGHEDAVTSVSYSPDGTRIASGGDSFDQTVRVWDAASDAELAVLRGHENLVTSVSYRPDGKRIASGSADNTVRVWDAASGVELAVLRGHEDSVECVSYSPDGTRIASGGSYGDKTVRVWHAARGAELHCLRGHERYVKSVSYSPDGARIVSSSGDCTVRVWDAASGAELLCLRGHKDTVMSVSYSPDGRRITSGGGPFDQTVRVWDAESGECLEVIEGRDDMVGIARSDGDIASGNETPIYRAIHRGQEMVVEHAASGQAIAWFAERLRHITTSPSDNQWAGRVTNYVCIVRLEGAAAEDSPARRAIAE